MDKQTATAAATITEDSIREDLAYAGYVMTYTYYGRGFVPSNAEQIGNVLMAFRAAQAAANGQPVIFCVDEDAFFALPGEPALGEDSDFDLESRAELIDSCRIDEVDSEDAALIAWWNNYAKFDTDENVPNLREDIAAVAGVDVEDLDENEEG